MRGEVNGGANVLLLQREDQIRNRETKDLDGIGQTKTDEGLGKAVVTPPDQDHADQNQRDDRYPNPLDRQEGARTTHDQAQQDPENAADHHESVTRVRCYPGIGA